jgi:hypothetical protein
MLQSLEALDDDGVLVSADENVVWGHADDVFSAPVPVS